MPGEVEIPESVLRRSYAFERLATPAAVLDASGVVVDTNEAWRLFAALNAGAPDTTGPGVDYLAVCDHTHASGLDPAGVVAAGLRSILRGDRRSFEIEYPCPSPIEDRWFVLHASAAPVHDGAGVVLFHVNVTARKLLEQRLGPEAGCDPTTGLPDRRVAIRLIEGGLAGTAPAAGRLTVINVSVAGVGAVRDELGRPAAEELLVQVTARARCALRVSDHFCQLGGDRLVVVCPDLDDAAAAAIVDRLHEAIAAPFQVGSDKVSVAAGVVVVVADAASTAESLLGAASAAGTVDVWADRQAQRSAVTITRPPSENGARSATADAWARPDSLIASAAAKAQRDAVVAHSDDLVMYFEADGTIAWASPATRALFGMDPDALVGRNSLDLIHPDDKDHAVTELSRISGFGEHTRCEFRVIADDGTVYWIEEIATNLIDDPQIGYVVGNLHDITTRKRDEEAIALQSRLLDAAGQAIVAVDMNGDVFYWNAAATHIYGWTAEETRGRPATELLVPAVGWAGRAEVVRDHVVVGEDWAGDFLVRRKDGSEVPVLVTNTPVLDDAGVQIGIIAVSSDITERMQLERDLWHQANYDALTGLANRTLLLDRLEVMLAPAGPALTDTRVGILLLDVDRFKLINDSLGHDRGDQLLVAIANVLVATLEPGEIAARFGGDGFAVVTQTRTAPEQLLDIAERIRARLANGLAIGADRYLATVSIGMVIASSADTATTALRDVDTAMYRAKETGRDRAAWFDPSLRRDVVASFEVERDLLRAIEQGQLYLDFQPVLDVETDEIASCEALVRWRHPERGVLGPDEFVPAAEHTGLIVSLGRWVLRDALATAAGWPRDVRLAVNLSPRELAEPDLVAFVKKTLADLNVDASRLVLEITETAVLQDPTAAARAISALRALGVGIIIDDFGTGYTSLSFLRDYQIDGLKIDRSFVTQIEHGSTAIVDAMIRMSAALGLEVIAEGIETEAQLARLRVLGCRFIQGYLVSRPVAPEDLPFLRPSSAHEDSLTNGARTARR